MCTTEQTFAWVGAIVVNVAFLSFIAWGASANWLVGFALSVVYTVLLFGLAHFVDTKSGWDRTAGGGNDGGAAADDGSLHDEVDVGVSNAIVTNDSERRMPPLANLFYGLFALALGGSGYFLPMNLYNCDGGGGHPYKPAGHWAANITALPENVQSWAISTEPRVSVANFVFIPGEKVTLFTGTAENEGRTTMNSLWAAPASVYPFNGGEPVHFPNVTHPSQFIVTGTGRACFFAYKSYDPPPSKKKYPPQPKSIYGMNIIGCCDCDGKTLTMTNPSINELHSPYDFFIDNSTKVLWFKDYPPTVGSQSGDGKLIYSISNYETMEVVLHSTYRKARSYEYTFATGDGYSKPYVPPEEKGSGSSSRAKNGMECMTKQSILALFVSAIPVSVVSILLWIKRNAPSMAITTYIGIGATASFIFTAARGNADYMGDFYEWWLSITGALFVLALLDLLSCKRKIARSPLVWGINFGSLAYFIGMINLTGIFDYPGGAWCWIIFNAFALVPLGLLGLATNQAFLLVLCAVGWLMDSVKLANWISDAMAIGEGPIQFVVLAISGLLIAGAGWLLSKHQEEVHNVLCYQFERISVSRKIFPEASGHVAVQTEEDGLLSPGPNSQRSGSNVC